MTSQVIALAACCDAPIFPFTDAFWALLFGLAPAQGQGGLMLGGGDLALTEPKGVKVGGAGDLHLGSFVLTEGGDYVLQETGFRINLE